tara:strand:- start:5863 stop:6930 length:1068 start_codon:yes stop_codon:yes gene_type:complete
MVGHKNFWKNKRVLITGHTGFKGAWLSIWLKYYGANVIGVSLDPPSKKNLFNSTNLKKFIKHYHQDILDEKKLLNIFKKEKPQVVFHMAAQSIVRLSYKQPRLTYETNIIGTLNILECIKKTKSVKSAILVTSDKCYENSKKIKLVETDPLGGDDIYSSSKGACEILINSYKSCFFDNNRYPQIASTRAGNVIGGGDWASDRIVPDIIRAISNKNNLVIRFPKAIRPWQHVFDPLWGYLMLAEKLYKYKGKYNSAWNFGPNDKSAKNVSELVYKLIELWGAYNTKIIFKKSEIKEKKFLMLNSLKAKKILGWSPRLNFVNSIKLTVHWYKKYKNKKDMMSECINQINYFEKLLKK